MLTHEMQVIIRFYWLNRIFSSKINFLLTLKINNEKYVNSKVGTNKVRKINPIKKPKQQRAKLKVDAILNSAKHLLTFEGVEKLTTNHIATHSGISVGSIYQYFPNKQAIICQIYFEWLDLVQEDIKKFIEKSVDADISQIIDELINDIYGLSYLDSEELSLDAELTKAMNLYPELREIENEHSQTVISLIAKIIENSTFVCCPEKAIQLAIFIYSLDASFQQFIHLNGDKYKALEWYKKSAKSVFES